MHSRLNFYIFHLIEMKSYYLLSYPVYKIILIKMLFLFSKKNKFLAHSWRFVSVVLFFILTVPMIPIDPLNVILILWDFAATVIKEEVYLFELRKIHTGMDFTSIFFFFFFYFTM